MAGIFDVGVAGQNTQNGLLAKDRRQDRNTDVDVGAGLEACAEVAVLRDAVLGNVKVRHDFDTRDQRLVQSTLQRHVVNNDAVDAHTDLRLALERLDVNIRRRRRDGTLHEAVQQTDDGRVEVAALGSHVDGQILGLGGGHVAVVGGAGRLAGADLGVIVADGAAQRLQLGQHDLRFEAGQLADVLKGVVVQRVVGGNRQRARTLRNRQHIVLLRKLLRDLLNGGHIDVGVLDVNHFELEALGQCLQDLTLIDVAKFLQSLADAQVAVLFLVGKGGVQLVGRDIAELDQNVAEADVFHGCTPPLSQRITFRDTLNAVAVTALPSVSAKLRVSMEKDTSCTDG